MSVSQDDVNEGRLNDQLGSQLEALSANVEAKMEQGRNLWVEWRSNLPGSASDMARALDDQAHRNPWPLVCGASAIGLLIGAILGRR
jgi:ElaB/YqjD/DUF883 family membrane-anchored ribosome-binding protein